jgi:hypothetical protein
LTPKCQTGDEPNAKMHPVSRFWLFEQMFAENKSVVVSLMGALLAGVLYCALHLLNSWLFKFVEVSDHINLVYLPAFIRLASVLILGMVWGTLGTSFGCLMLLNWSHDANIWISLANLCVSAGVAALSVYVLQTLARRRLSIIRLVDLVQLALLYALLNALLHHALWSAIDPSQLLYPAQMFEMILGDINGALIGALVLRWIALKSKLTTLLHQRVSENAPR